MASHLVDCNKTSNRAANSHDQKGQEDNLPWIDPVQPRRTRVDPHRLHIEPEIGGLQNHNHEGDKHGGQDDRRLDWYARYHGTDLV